MDQAAPSPAHSPAPAEDAEARRPADAADAAMTEYVGYLASWFDIAQLAVGLRLNRTRGPEPLLNDA